ncbi:hypothetical protein [Myxococcus sp. Y35]|uniref:hypothetical protein n=1 Tax=Pseudomyxococcus flavus TaxID=3115648 RepID=UPI003CF430E6
MSSTVLASHARRGRAQSLGVTHLFVLALLSVSGGCAVEDPVARLRNTDGGTGSFSSEDEALRGEEGLWLGPEDVPPDCVYDGMAPDSGTGCEDAGTPDAP